MNPDGVSPKTRAMTIQVCQDQVDGLPHVFCRPALGTLPAQRSLEALEGRSDLVEVLRRWVLLFEPENGAQSKKQALLVDLKDAAEILGIPIAAVRRLVAQKIGCRLFVLDAAGSFGLPGRRLRDLRNEFDDAPHEAQRQAASIFVFLTRGSTNRCFLHARDQAVARNTPS